MDKVAVLIPCYNESKTIKKVVEDFKEVLPEAVIYMIIIHLTTQLKLLKKQGQLCDMNISREREM